jgi:hypothetical protein
MENETDRGVNKRVRRRKAETVLDPFVKVMAKTKKAGVVRDFARPAMIKEVPIRQPKAREILMKVYECRQPSSEFRRRRSSGATSDAYRSKRWLRDRRSATAPSRARIASRISS